MKKIRGRAQSFKRLIRVAFQSLSEKEERFVAFWSANFNVPLLKLQNQKIVFTIETRAPLDTKQKSK